MRPASLIWRSLSHYWRTNAAVVAGVAVAVSVLAGALTVGVSVRESLRAIALERIGATDHAIVGERFFRETVAGAFDRAAPIVAVEGFVSAQESGRRASRVQVYGVDERFAAFHQIQAASPAAGDAFLSEALAAELGASAGGSVVLRVDRASPIPAESLHGRKDGGGRSVRLTVRTIVPRGELGEFSLSPTQGAVRAMFVSLRRLQSLIEQPERVNVVLTAGGDAAAAERRLRRAVGVEDFDLRVRALEAQGALAVESRSAILSDQMAAAAIRAAGNGFVVIPALTYLANTIRAGDRQVPYSTITAIDFAALGWGALASPDGGVPIVLNEWAARDLGARPGDRISIEYFVWETEGRLITRTAEFRLARVLPIEGVAADRDLVPDYPGITDSDRVADWDPPFPIDLGRVRPADEEYWERYRATPKAFIPLDRGQQLWSSRHGALTTIRLVPSDGRPLSGAREGYESQLRAGLDPLASGFSVHDVRAQNLRASAGSTDFGEYFTYFSTFLVVSALLLAGLFFKLGIDQRMQEVGLLRAVGFSSGAIRRLFVGEAAVLSAAGALAGCAGALAYAALVMLGLRTWWVGAVGTTALALHVNPAALAVGSAGAAVMAIASIWWSLRALGSAPARGLLTGDRVQETARRRGTATRAAWAAGAAAVLSVLLLAGTAVGLVPRVAGFFGSGSLSMLALLACASAMLRRGRWGRIGGTGALALWRLGWRSTAYRPGRSVLCVALLAFATFVIVSVEAFKRDTGAGPLDRQSGSGGFPLIAETMVPVVHDPNDPAGREELNLADPALKAVRFERFRLRPGDDTSCLNLYQPANPRILGAPAAFIAAGRFAFHSSLAQTDEERANPWVLLTKEFSDAAIPVIADANSMTYVLHRKLGDVIELPGTSGRPTRLRLVAALSDSILQGELVMAESRFVQAFPEWDGYRVFLVDAPLGQTGEIAGVLESRLADFGIDVTPTAERLAGFHRVEYTYLSTFQMLGGLGLVLGTFGMGAILLRNVIERRRELALLRALGYTRADFAAIAFAEHVLLLAGGLAVGAFCALLAIAPTWLERGGRFPAATLAWLMMAVLAAGLIASLGATAAALRAPLLPALRAE